VAARPPADVSALALPSVGHWVRALSVGDVSLDAPPLLAAFALLTEIGAGKRSSPRAVTARRLLDALPAYRNEVIGHGAPRAAEFYHGAAVTLIGGLEALWFAGAIWPAGATLDRSASKDANAPPGNLYRRTSEGSVDPLHPWVLHREGPLGETFLFFNGFGRSPKYLDYLSGESLRGPALAAAFPGVEKDLAALFGEARAEEAEKHDPSLFGDYRLLGKLGEGGMGVVYLALQEGLGRVVALKMLPLDAAQDAISVARFRREVAALSRCDHPNVVKILASGEAQGTHYYAMELIEGADLTQISDSLSSGDDIDRAISTASDRVRRARAEAFSHLPDVRAAGPDAARASPLAGPGADRPRRLAALFRDAARGVHHLHEAGIVHRDLKPGNLMVTAQDHRIVVMDLGLAAMTDASRSISRERRSVLGTLRYMPPEQLLRNLAAVDRRADVYALGATLYELLTDRRFHDGDSEARLMEQVLHETPPSAERVGRGVPHDLSVIVAKATEKDAARRYETAAALAADLDAFLEGRPIAARAPTLGYVLRLAVARNPGFAATASAFVVVALLGTVFFVVREARLRREAEEHLAEIRRLADVKRLDEFTRAQAALWPAIPEKVPAMRTWLGKARALAERLPLHRAKLAELRTTATAPGPPYVFASNEAQWEHDTLEGLVEGLDRFISERPESPTAAGALSSVEARLRSAETIRARSIERHAEAWAVAIAEIADLARSPAYKGLRIRPQVGLVPLGRDPASGLQEFAHLDSGEPPARGPDGKLALREETGVVLVLLPGGSFRMGAVRPSEAAPDETNIDPSADDDEKPAHDRAIAPFFMSKFETTFAQWYRRAGTSNSIYEPGDIAGGKKVSALHPVEYVNHIDASEVARRLGLRLPSEPEWEYAARAGTTTPYFTGADPRSLVGAANIADRYLGSNGGQSTLPIEDWLDDGHTAHAPVGTYRPNGFGIHDTVGNVGEWTADWYELRSHLRYARGDLTPPEYGGKRVFRGGSWSDTSKHLRASFRYSYAPEYADGDIGFRMARSIDG